MDKEELMKMAREAGLLFNGGVGPDRAHALKKERIEEFASAILERAAKHFSDHSYGEFYRDEVAEEIRALKPSNDA